MQKSTDIHSIMIIDNGPIVIGQARELDDSGAQACKALRAVGCRVILVNSAPATIMTDFLANGPGEPAVTGVYAVPAIEGVLGAGVPLFGISLGHQLLGLAFGVTTDKLEPGDRGAEGKTMRQPAKMTKFNRYYGECRNTR